MPGDRQARGRGQRGREEGVLGGLEAVGLGACPDQWKAVVSAMAALRRASPKVLSHSVNGEFVATAVALHCSRSVKIWNGSSTPLRSSEVAESIQTKKIDFAVAGEHEGQALADPAQPAGDRPV